MRLHRLISILLTIENKGKVTANKLAEQLETSTRTIYRDIDILGESGIPLITETGPNGGISLMEGYQIAIKQIRQEDIICLYLNGMGIKADRNSELATKTNSTLMKLQKSLSKEDSTALHSIINRFYVDDSPWWGTRNSLKNIDIIMKALWQSSKLTIDYEKVNGSLSKRVIRPYGIAVKNMDWYLVAYCESSNALRTFKCERITDSEIIIDSFIIPDAFSLEEYFKTSIHNFHSECNALEQYPVTLKLSLDHRCLLNNCEIYSSSEKDNFLEANINMYSFDSAMDNFWNLLCNSYLISPLELKEAVKNKLKFLMQQYEANDI